MTAPDLRVGDVVKARAKRWPEGSFIQGAVYEDLGGTIRVCGYMRDSLRTWDVEVISRAPRPFYVNADRDPVPGDVVVYKSGYTGNQVGPFLHTGKPQWAGGLPGGRETPWVGIPDLHPDTGPLYAAGRVVLIVDGTTGKPVTA